MQSALYSCCLYAELRVDPRLAGIIAPIPDREAVGLQTSIARLSGQRECRHSHCSRRNHRLRGGCLTRHYLALRRVSIGSLEIHFQIKPALSFLATTVRALHTTYLSEWMYFSQKPMAFWVLALKLFRCTPSFRTTFRFDPQMKQKMPIQLRNHLE